MHSVTHPFSRTRCRLQALRVSTCCARERRRSEGARVGSGGGTGGSPGRGTRLQPHHQCLNTRAMCLPRITILFKATGSALTPHPHPASSFSTLSPASSFSHHRVLSGSRMWGRSTECCPSSQSPRGCFSVGQAPGCRSKWTVDFANENHVFPDGRPMRARDLCTQGEARAELHVSGRGEGAGPAEREPEEGCQDRQGLRRSRRQSLS